MRNLILIFLYVGMLSQLSGQDYIPFYKEFNSIDSLISYGEYKKASRKIKSLDRDYILHPSLYYRLSKELVETNKALARAYFKKGVKNGLVEATKFEGWYSEVAKFDSIHFNAKIIKNIDSEIQSAEEHKEYIELVKNCIDVDVSVRRLIHSKRIEGYPSITQYGADIKRGTPKIDSTIHSTYTREYNEFWRKDSTNILQFVNYVLKKGYIPTPHDIGYAVNPYVLLVHSGKFDFDPKYYELVLKSVMAGGTFPSTYAWMMSLKCEYKKEECHYYFNNSVEFLEELDQSQKDLINRKRDQIGVKPIPALIWNRRIYNPKTEWGGL